jgi:cytochrome c oxidase assembly protein subunit 15
MQAMSTPVSSAPDRRLFGLCLLTLGWSVLVLQAGGFTTSIQAGMAFLDWPLSNGSVNPPGWLTEIDKFAEHSHRLAATGLGLLCVALAVAHGFLERRRPVRLAAYALLGLVVLQGLLGGLRVMLDRLNIGGEGNFKAVAFAVGHAVNAQLALALLAVIATAHCRAWHQAGAPADRRLFRVGLTAALLTLSVIIVGAVMRQGRFTVWSPEGSAGLFLPSVGDGLVWWINLAHRGGALLAALAVLFFAFRLARHGFRATRWAPLVALVCLQVLLGLLSIQLPLNPHVRTVHLVVGAALFCSLCSAAVLARRTPETALER